MSEEGKVQSAQPQFGDKALLEHLDEMRGKLVIMPPDDTVTGYARGRADGYQAGVLSLSGLERAAYQRGAEAMREAAARAVLMFPRREASVAEATGWMRAMDVAATAIRALPLPEDKA